MKIKILLTIIVALIVGIGVYYVINKPSVNQVIDKSISQDTSELKNEQETEEIESDIEEESENIEPVNDQFKEKVTDAVINTVEFFFKKEFHFVALGDSLTQGVGDSSGEGGYIGILDKTINSDKQIVEFENFGKAGHRTDQLLKRLDEPEIISSITNTDIILITIGANDIMQVVKENFTNLTYPQFAKEQVHFEERLNDIFIKLNEINPNTHIYLLGIYNPFEQYFQDIEELDLIVNEWNQTGIKTAEKYENITFIPMKDIFDEAEENLFSEDHFHPNKSGYRLMATRVLEYLSREER